MENAVPNLEAAIREMRTFDAIAVLGAGMSFLAGMPLANQLPPLVWQTLDQFPDLSVAISSELGISTESGKTLIGDDSERIKVAFTHIAGNKTARVYFQKTFANLDRERAANFSSAHAALARLVHCGRIEHVVSLNWDTLLETAYQNRYGIDINSGGVRMCKPHGDCKRPEDDWVLPNELGRVSNELVNRMKSFATERPRTLLIIGYSEGDETVVQRLIQPLANRWRVFRIGPNAINEGAIRLGAQEALREIAQKLCPDPEVEGWEYVTFASQRGIEGAISGERLGNRDVQACPRLPNYGAALDRLRILHNVEILGEAGSGKSITAWQLAAEYQAEGYEVLQADITCAWSVEHRVRSAMQAPGRKALVVDDTQIFQAELSHRLNQLASPDTKVILATTDPESPRPGSVRIPARGAVETLAAAFRQRRNEVLETVRRYDPLIGDRYLDISIERRIDDASKATTPWQFCFILRGGWQQARERLKVLRDFDRADVLLVVVAARQMLSLDAGTSSDDLIQDASKLGKSKEWVEKALSHLVAQSAILIGSQIRCPHIRFAGIVIESFFGNNRDVEFASVASLLRMMILDQMAALRGISWLLQELFLTNSFLLFHDTKSRLLQPEDVYQLFRRCLDATGPIERRDAASLISHFLGWQALNGKEVLAHGEVIRLWLESIGAIEAYGISFLVNNLYNHDKEAARELVESADPERIAGRLQSVLPSDAYVWGHFVDRCWLAAGDSWRDRLRNAIDRDSIRALMTRFTGLELADLSEYLVAIACLDFSFANECLGLAIPAIEEGLKESPLDSWLAIEHIRWGILGQSPFGASKSSKAQNKLAKRIAGFLNGHKIASGLLHCRIGDWEPYGKMLSWIGFVNPSKHREIIQQIDWPALDCRTIGHWNPMVPELPLLVIGLAGEGKNGPVCKMVATHVGEIKEIDPITAGVCPEVAVAVLSRGGRLKFWAHWAIQTWCVARLAELDKGWAKNVVISNEQFISSHVQNMEGVDSEELPEFLSTLEYLDQSLLVHLFQRIDIAIARVNWRQHIQDVRKEVRQGTRRVLGFVQRYGQGESRELASRLVKTRPRLRKKT